MATSLPNEKAMLTSSANDVRCLHLFLNPGSSGPAVSPPADDPGGLPMGYYSAWLPSTFLFQPTWQCPSYPVSAGKHPMSHQLSPILWVPQPSPMPGILSSGAPHKSELFPMKCDHGAPVKDKRLDRANKGSDQGHQSPASGRRNGGAH